MIYRLFTIPKLHSPLFPIWRAIADLTGAVKAMSETVASELSTLQADVAALTTEVATANTTIAAFASDLAAAIAAGAAGGLTADQMQAFSDLHTAITTATSSLTSTIAGNPLPADPNAPPAPAAA